MKKVRGGEAAVEETKVNAGAGGTTTAAGGTATAKDRESVDPVPETPEASTVDIRIAMIGNVDR